MVTLANVDPRLLSTDLGQAGQNFFQAFDAVNRVQLDRKRLELLEAQVGQEQQQLDVEAKRQARIDSSIETVLSGKGTPQEKAMTTLSILEPQGARAMESIQQSRNEEGRKKALFAAQQDLKQAAFVRGAKDAEGRQRRIKQLAAAAIQRGESPAPFAELANLPDDQLQLELIRRVTVGTATETLTKDKFEQIVDPVTGIELERNIRSGQTTPSGFQNVVDRIAGREQTALTATLGRISKEGISARSIASKEGIAARKINNQKNVQTWLGPNDQILQSTDGGRNAINLSTGVTAPMPEGAVRLGAESGVAEARAAKARSAANKAIKDINPDLGKATTPQAMAAASNLGTGPISNLLAAVDAIVGGTFNLETMFPDTTRNRQQLRLIRQLAKPALLTSARGAVYDQMNVEALFPNEKTFFTNPQTEAQKVPILIDILNEELALNNAAIANGGLPPKEIAKLQVSSLGLERALSRLVGPAGTTGGDVIRFDANGNIIQ